MPQGEEGVVGLGEPSRHGQLGKKWRLGNNAGIWSSSFVKEEAIE